MEKGLCAFFLPLLSAAAAYSCHCSFGAFDPTQRRKYLISLQRVCFTLFSWSFQTGIKEIYRSFVTKCDRNRSGPSVGSVDVKTLEYRSTVAEVVSSRGYPWVGCLGFFCWVLFYLGQWRTASCYCVSHCPGDKWKQLIVRALELHCLETLVSAFYPSRQVQWNGFLILCLVKVLLGASLSLKAI